MTLRTPLSSIALLLASPLFAQDGNEAYVVVRICAFAARLAADLHPADFARVLRALTGKVTQAATAEDLQLQGIGEWGIQVTPMELAAGYRRLAQQRTRPA